MFLFYPLLRMEPRRHRCALRVLRPLGSYRRGAESTLQSYVSLRAEYTQTYGWFVALIYSIL